MDLFPLDDAIPDSLEYAARFLISEEPIFLGLIVMTICVGMVLLDRKRGEHNR